AGVASSCRRSEGSKRDWKALVIGTLLHLLHPLARLYGRLKYGLHPWRRRGAPRLLAPRRRTISIWSEQWQSPEDWLRSVQAQVRAEGATAFAGGAYDHWDLEIQGGLFGGVRLCMAAEEHGGGRQMLRFRIWPRCAVSGFVSVAL